MLLRVSQVIFLSFIMAVLSPVKFAIASGITQLGASEAWGSMKATDPDECWAVSAPNLEQTKNFRNGKQIGDVNRGEGTQFYAIYSLASGKGLASLAFTGGEYQFDDKQPVKLEIDGLTFSFTVANEPDRGWAYTSVENENKLIPLFKAGSSFTVTSVSARGTTSIDRFSLIGFTAAYEAAVQACK